MAEAARRLYQLTGQAQYQSAAARAMGRVASLAVSRPVSFGAALATMVALTAPVAQLVVVANAAAPIAALARSFARPAAVVAVVTEAQAAGFAAAGFELFEARITQAGRPTAYLCRDFVCHLPLTDATALAAELRALTSRVRHVGASYFVGPRQTEAETGNCASLREQRGQRALFLAEITPVSKPPRYRPPWKRACSTFMQRSMTTVRPLLSPYTAAS